MSCVNKIINIERRGKKKEEVLRNQADSVRVCTIYCAKLWYQLKFIFVNTKSGSKKAIQKKIVVALNKDYWKSKLKATQQIEN